MAKSVRVVMHAKVNVELDVGVWAGDITFANIQAQVEKEAEEKVRAALGSSRAGSVTVEKVTAIIVTEER